jgi:malate dehydrogenase
LFRIASGEVFGRNQPIILHLIEVDVPEILERLKGTVMEIEDCAFPLLKGIVATGNLDAGFKGVNWCLLVGAAPRKAGMERKDLLGANGKIFVGQGKAIQKNAASDVRVLVVGNPCNTNALICMNNAPNVPRDRFFAMTRLDENRAKAQLAKKASVDITAVTNLAIWGNHSSTMFPDFYNALIATRPVTDVIKHNEWLEGFHQHCSTAVRLSSRRAARPAPPALRTRQLTRCARSSIRQRREIEQRCCAHRRQLRRREGTHQFLPDPQQRQVLGNRPRPAA